MVTVVDRLNLRKVLPEASGTAGCFWNASRLIAFLSFAPRLGV